MMPSGGPQHPRSHQPIGFSKVLLVEGRDDFGFFLKLLETIGLHNQIEVRNYGGTTRLDYLQTLMRTSGWHGVTSLGISRDAESGGAQSAFQSVCNALTDEGLPVPTALLEKAGGNPEVSVFILPDCSSSGTLEDLLLRCVADDPALPCVEQYFDCLKDLEVNLQTNPSKARIQAFLASRSEYLPFIGTAARAGCWPMDHPALDLLKTFLRNL